MTRSHRLLQLDDNKLSTGLMQVDCQDFLSTSLMQVASTASLQILSRVPHSSKMQGRIFIDCPAADFSSKSK